MAASARPEYAMVQRRRRLRGAQMVLRQKTADCWCARGPMLTAFLISTAPARASAYDLRAGAGAAAASWRCGGDRYGMLGAALRT